MNAPRQTPIRVSIIEDNPDERSLYASIVDSAADMRCVSQHPNAAHALRELPQVKPHVVLVDIVMPRCSGVECVRQLKTLLPQALLVMLTKHADDDFIFDSVKAGAVGYLLKAKIRDSLPGLIRHVCREEVVMTPEVARRVLAFFFERKTSSANLVKLSPREEEVLHLVAQGRTSKQIAERLGCSPNTIDRHTQHICEKLHVSGRVAAANKYFGQRTR